MEKNEYIDNKKMRGCTVHRYLCQMVESSHGSQQEQTVHLLSQQL